MPKRSSCDFHRHKQQHDLEDRPEGHCDRGGELMEWIPTTWQPKAAFENTRTLGGIRIDRIVSPFYDGERYAVRDQFGAVLNRSGEWEHEPLPSSRDDAFYERCRFMSFKEAQDAAEELS